MGVSDRAASGQESGEQGRISGRGARVLIERVGAHLSQLDPQDDLPRPVYAPERARPLVPPDWLDQAPVTRTLLALNLGIFGLEIVLSRSAMHILPGVAMQLGASYPLATVGEGRWETLVTACFLHGSLLHVGFNMLALWQAGPLVERTVGSARMAPMYLVAGAFGNVLSVAHAWVFHAGTFGTFSVGASGAVSGVLAAALVVGWRMQGWRGPVTQAMARWLGFVVVFGLLSNRLGGGNIDNAAHIGGAVAGGAIAAGWRLRYRYPDIATRAVLGSCVALVAVCIGVLSLREATSQFAAMTVQGRQDYTMGALSEGHCRDAHDGLLAVERLERKDSLRKQVEMMCGHVDEP
jgi:rhomboid protease GluP